jgi:hypothetical protein
MVRVNFLFFFLFAGQPSKPSSVQRGLHVLQDVTLCVPLNDSPWRRVVSSARHLSPRKSEATDFFSMFCSSHSSASDVRFFNCSFWPLGDNVRSLHSVQALLWPQVRSPCSFCLHFSNCILGFEHGKCISFINCDHNIFITSLVYDIYWHSRKPSLIQ